MFSPFDYPGPVAADHLDEHGYPALAELHREHGHTSGRYDHYDDYTRGHKELGRVGAPKVFDSPYFDIFNYSKNPSDNSTYSVLMGKHGEGYRFFSKVPEDLKDRVLSELTGRTDLARELPEVEGTTVRNRYHANFSSGNNNYKVRMQPMDGLPNTHEFYFSQKDKNADEDIGITGAGHAMETMTKAAAHLVKGLKTVQPKHVLITAKEPSRQKLYETMLKHLPRFAPEYERRQVSGKGKYLLVRKDMQLSRDMIDDDEPSGPEGWIDEDGNFHENQPGPYGVRHNDTLTRLGYKNVGEGIRAGLMHLGSADGSQLLGHRSDRQYTPKQLGTLKKLATKHNLEPAITTTSNGTVTTRSLKLKRDTKVTLAAEVTGKAKAPAGGMVSNNQFYEGGKFLPRALKSIREVRNRKLSKQKTKGTKVMGAPEKLMSPE